MTYKAFYLMPYVGFGFDASRFSFYVNVGYNLASFNCDLIDKSQYYNETDTFSYNYSGKGSSIGALFGLQYNFSQKFSIKFEYMYANIGSIKGDLDYRYFNSDGDSDDQTVNGDFYSYEYYLSYEKVWTNSFSVFTTEPQETSKRRSIKKMALDFSGFRILFGFTF